MAIKAYVGLPRSGKSYSVVEYVILAILNSKSKTKRRIWTNIPMVFEELEKDYPQVRTLITQFDIQDILDNPDWFQDVFEAGATLIMDELWRLWPAGLLANKMEQGHKSFLAEHGHMVGHDAYSTEVIYVTQDLSQIAAYPRNLVESTNRTVKLNAIGASTKYRVDIYGGCVTGPNPPKSQILRKQFGSYKPAVYRYYKSQTMNEGDSHGDESSTDNRMNILASPWLKFGFPILIIFLVVFVYLGVQKTRGNYQLEAKNPTQQLLSNSEKNDFQGKIVKKNHFFDDMQGYISFNNGFFPDVDYHLTFIKDDLRVTFDQPTLSKMGYKLRPFHQCYVQLVGFSQELDLYCKKDESVAKSVRAPVIANPFENFKL